MRQCTVTAFALVLLASAASAGEMPWAKNWEDARKQATQSKKLMMVDFYTDW